MRMSDCGNPAGADPNSAFRLRHLNLSLTFISQPDFACMLYGVWSGVGVGNGMARARPGGSVTQPVALPFNTIAALSS